jgi:hypothetical protein
MKVHGRLMLFSVVGSIAYTLAYYFDWSLFQYYVVEGRFHISPLPESAGPPILWYGWLATAALAGLAIALATPRRLIAWLLPDLVWLIPFVTLFAALMYEMRWFL